MNITPVTSAAVSNRANPQVNLSQVQTDFKSLATALQSGDLESAQSAFAQLQQNAPQLVDSSTGLAGSGTSSRTDGNFSTLSTALQSGDLQGAQQAFAAIQQTAAQGHHHHHHGGGGAKSALGADFHSLATALQSGDLTGAQSAFGAIRLAQQPSSSATTDAATDGSTDPVKSDFQSLSTALQTGDLGGAQQVFTAMLQAYQDKNGLPLYSVDGASANANALTGALINTAG